MIIKIYNKGDVFPFYRPYKGEMNAVFGTTCIVKEYENEVIISKKNNDINPFIITDKVYLPMKSIRFEFEEEFDISEYSCELN